MTPIPGNRFPSPAADTIRSNDDSLRYEPSRLPCEFRPSRRNGNDAGVLKRAEAHRCPRFSLNSAEKPPRKAFSRQNCRHDSLRGKPNRGFPEAVCEYPQPDSNR
jgi:hypothetical protein